MPKLKLGGVEFGLPHVLRPGVSLACAALLAGLALTSLSGPVRAQSPAPQADRESEASSAEDRLVLMSHARCLARREHARATALVLSDFTTPGYRASLHNLATGAYGCNANGRLRFGGLLFVGDLAETLLPAIAPAGSLASHIALNPAVAPFQAHNQSEVMSACVVRAAPADTEALLATEQGSSRELAALQAVAPRIGPCLASGVSMRLNRPGIRAMLALAAYRLAQHNAAAPAAAAGN